MRKVLLVTTVLLIAVFGFAKTVDFTVFHTSDLHGNIFPVDYASNRPSDVGLAKISTLLNAVREENKNVLTIDTGDFIQGTPLEYYHAKIDNEPVDPMVLAMNAMKFDCTVVGNHEFNYGMDLLNKAVGEADFPFLSANVTRRFTETPYYKPYEIFEVEGIRVAVLGLTTNYIPNWEDPKNIAAVDFMGPVEVAKKYVPLLRTEEQADVVIVAYHGGLEKDPVSGKPTEVLTGENQGYRLLEQVQGIDVLLTGHQHRGIAGFVLGVPVSQPSNWGKAAGIVKLSLDNASGKWMITAKSVALQSTKGVEADQTIIDLCQDYEDKVQAWLDTPVGEAKGEFYVEDPLALRLADESLIEFINKVQMAYAGVDISSSALFNNSIKGWEEGPVTLRDINGVYIYANTLKVIEVSGQDIKDAIEISATYFTLDENGEITVSKSWVDPKPRHYNYDMWEGIEYIIDVSQPEGSRVVKLDYHGKPMDMSGTYQVALNNYRAGGGGNYTMFKGKPVVKEVMVEVSELMGTYLIEAGVIEATADGNWKVIK